MNGKRKQRASRAFDLEERLVDFAVRILNLVEALPSTKAGNHDAGQLLEVRTSKTRNQQSALDIQFQLSHSDFEEPSMRRL